VPYLHVTQSPWSTVHGAYESLEYTIARGIFPLLVLGVIYLTAVTVGRLFCGWACPFGLVQVRSGPTRLVVAGSSPICGTWAFELDLRAVNNHSSWVLTDCLASYRTF
jgi:hypothetical protein